MWSLAAEVGEQIRHLRPQQSTLEEIFLKAIEVSQQWNDRSIMPIFDQGYQHWKGRLSGHAWRWLAITRHGIRTQLKGRYVRLLLVLAWMPALTLVGALAVWGLFEQGAWARSCCPCSGPRHNGRSASLPAGDVDLAYSFFFQTELYFILLLVTLAGPNLISLDLRYNALPLYLSRPVTRLDYFLGKLGVIAALVAAVAVLPAAAAYVLGVCFSLDLTVVRDTWRLLPASIVYGLLIVVSAGTLMLALSSMSRRSLYVGLTWVGLFLIGWVVAGVLGDSSRSIVISRTKTSVDRASGHRPRTQRQPADPSRSSTRRLCRRTSDAPHARAAWPAADAAIATGNERLAASPAGSSSRPKRIAEDRLAAVVLLHGQSRSPGRGNPEHRCRLGADRPRLRAAAGPSRIDVRHVAGTLAATTTPQPVNERRLAENWVPQYPWTWSAAVLAGLLGLSLCILSTRVKSLDRLR